MQNEQTPNWIFFSKKGKEKRKKEKRKLLCQRKLHCRRKCARIAEITLLPTFAVAVPLAFVKFPPNHTA